MTGRISKIGDAGVRTALYEAANVILTRPVKGSSLKSWAMRLAKRAGMRKAKVALARKLAVVLHRMLADGTTFIADKAAAARQHKQKERSRGSGGTDTSRPEQVPSPGRWIRSGRKCAAAPQGDRASVRLAGRSSSDPIRWRPRADPGQKQDTGDRISSKGIDTRGPLQKRFQRRCP